MLLSDFRIKIFVGCAAAIFLSGCFTTMYGGSEGGALADRMKSVQIDPIPDRMGHYLADSLIFAFNGTGGSTTAHYRLEVKPKERVETPIVNTVTGQASSATVDADAQFSLFSLPGNALLMSGTAFTSAAYDRSMQQFSNITAAQDAEKRDADSLADQIRIRIASYFANHPELK